MCVGGVYADGETGCDLFGSETFYHAAEEFQLARAEGDGRSHGLGETGEEFHDAGGDVR